jgi:putative ABC transport system permease protein
MRRFFQKLFRRRRLQQDLEAELQFHRELSAANDNPIPLGDSTRIKEEVMDVWSFMFIENLWRDLVYGIRGLRRSPALVATAVASIALGIGANTTIFSLAVEFLLSKPSVVDPGSVVSVRLGGNSHSSPKVVEFLRQSGVFQEVVGDNINGLVNWSDGAQTRTAAGAFTSKNYFSALGIPMAYGRGVIPEDPDEVAVLQHEFWKKNFGEDPSIVGRTISIDGRVCTVVGILPSNHRALIGFGFSPEIYLPRYLEDTRLAVYARLRPGMSLDQATAGVRTVAAQLDVAYPERWKYADGIQLTPVSGLGRVLQNRKTMLTFGLFAAMLMTVVGLVLLIACMNVAALLMARASNRRHEIAIRLSLGAGRGRLLQQLLTESLVLCVIGTGLGFALAQGLATMLTKIRLPIPVPIRLTVELDWRVALYAAFLAVGTTLACGLLPALQAVRESLSSDVRRERRLRMRRTLVASQIAVTVIVLCAGFLFLRNLFESNALSPGFDLRNTLRADVNLPRIKYRDPRKIESFVGQALEALKALPGIEEAAAARIIPFTDASTYGGRIHFLDGNNIADSGKNAQTRFYWNAVSPEYFRAMQIPLLQGRNFTATDRGESKVVIVNRTFVDRYLVGKPPLGVRFRWGAPDQAPFAIVGVVEGTKNMTIGEEDQPQIYQPLAQIVNDSTRIQFVLRSTASPAGQLKATREALRRVEPAAGADVSTLYSSIGLAFFPSQIGAGLMGAMGLLGLVLAAVGLYGTMIYSVNRRTREIGVRMALGATRGDVVRMVLLESAKLVGAGSAIGVFVAFFVTKPLAAFVIPGLKPSDPLTLLAGPLVLLLTGILASWGPARRAVSVDPIASLRHE